MYYPNPTYSLYLKIVLWLYYEEPKITTNIVNIRLMLGNAYDQDKILRPFS